ncbi:hypothetical protein SpCBS45565_g00893 [Spizellomyces sp. 'palustris']|nr:hypothetical protein SpCBS45565_g00893 [Spizellomyces sp. 'palustris']
MSQDQVMDIASTHYERLRSYLSAYLQSQRASGNQSNQRTSAREKLTRLTKQQFTELSTDVFDEMNRRQLDSKEVPFLPVRDDFHPKRNQARQKLATLPSSRFKDLASDVYYEIERRFPTVVEDYNAKYGVLESPDRIASAPLTNGPQLSLSPEPKTVQVTGGAPYANTQMYETQYSQPYEGKALSAPANGPKSAEIGAVNFTSLDNLMADLGSMLTSPKGGYDAGSADVEKLKREYEGMQSRVKQLELELAETLKSKDRVADLEDKLGVQHKINAEQASKLETLDAKYTKLKEDFESLQDDYNNQQQIANDIRSEATNLLDEIKSLSRKNEELVAERERDKGLIKQLRDELARYRGEDAGGGPRDTPNIDFNRDDLGDDDGVIDRSRVTAYQSAVDDLLRAARSDVPTSVLVAMKAIVIACKNITEDTETFESTSSSLTDSERDQLADTKNQLAGALNNLMNAAKVHATSLGSANVGVLDGAATQLTSTIVELVKCLRLKRGEERGRPESFEIDELKIFLEKQTDQIVQAIQTLLIAMRQTSTLTPDFSATVSGITSIVDNLVTVSQSTLSKPSALEFRSRGEGILSDLSAANIRLEELGKSMVSEPGSKSLKQRLASSSYEIAKYVKELISLIE